MKRENMKTIIGLYDSFPLCVYECMDVDMCRLSTFCLTLLRLPSATCCIAYTMLNIQIICTFSLTYIFYTLRKIRTISIARFCLFQHDSINLLFFIALLLVFLLPEHGASCYYVFHAVIVAYTHICANDIVA